MDELQPKAGYADTETASSGGSQQVSEQTIAEQEASYAHAAPRITLSQLVNLCIEKGASDIHFREGGRVSLRVGGKMIFIENIESLTKDETMDMVKELMQNDREIKKLENVKETDFSYTYSNGVNFRVNLFFQKGKIAGVMRMISKHVPSMSELGIPEAVKSILNNREGLILVCGTAGSGKSTSVQSMIEYINNNFVKHIITIENPIEYVFEDKKSIITQREIGKDTLSANAALKSATREDANIIMVSEICSYEMLDELLDLVETGHLVIATMLTKDSSQTAERILSLYPQDLKKRAQDRVASDLIAIVSQDLVQRQDQQGLIAIFELMFMNPSISQIIKRGNFVQLRTAIQAGGEEGMITMDRYAYELAHQGIISQNIAAEYQQREEQ
jgi:twitching motility protein PilT